MLSEVSEVRQQRHCRPAADEREHIEHFNLWSDQTPKSFGYVHCHRSPS